MEDAPFRLPIGIVATYARSDHDETLLLTDENEPSCIISERSRARTRLSTFLRTRAWIALWPLAPHRSARALSPRAHTLIGTTIRATWHARSGG